MSRAPLTDDLIARLRGLRSMVGEIDQSIADLGEEAAEALAAASRPPQEPTAQHDADILICQLIDQWQREGGCFSRKEAAAALKVVLERIDASLAPAPPAAPPPWQPESEETRADRFHEKWMTLSIKLRALKRYSGDEIACYASSYEWVNAESLDEILEEPTALPSPPASAPQPESCSLKRRDTPENRAFWDFVERTAAECRANRPEWAKRLEELVPASAPQPTTTKDDSLTRVVSFPEGEHGDLPRPTTE